MADLSDILAGRRPNKKKQEELFTSSGSLLDIASGKTSMKGKSAKIGKQFEKELKNTCKLYKDQKLAYIQFAESPMVFVPAKKYWVHGSKTGFDFIGAIVKTKEPIFMEVKSTEHGTIPIGYDTSGIKKHQIEAMDWLEEVGFNPFFLWEIRRAGIVYKFYPHQIPKDQNSLSIQECEERKFIRILKQSFQGEMLYDFLEIL